MIIAAAVALAVALALVVGRSVTRHEAVGMARYADHEGGPVQLHEVCSCTARRTCDGRDSWSPRLHRYR
jgi:hypothetical protein